MNVAVLTLTRDRLPYTQHCFATLNEMAGCDFDHYVLDQNSQDGTAEWLAEDYVPYKWSVSTENLGISRGMNLLLDALEGDYDVVVKFDNDCELVKPGTLRKVCELVMDSSWLLSPRILGLNRPPVVRARYNIGGDALLEVPQIGGIFLAAPAGLYDTFRFNEANPVWGGDDVEICQGRRCGYVERLEAWHYEGTTVQWGRFPAYFDRTRAEGKAVL